ncbi:hypothetical protein CQW23_19911 [Capsicum baccatum]|uniref:Uncharacterized protein n=1 Tax=Capsicum baccatum TaxID=33114 RepID=A0A2G2W768_CAPBA|nr:hypothetical protein CQW23_19911 [Capsicum baccatum]
MSFDNLGSLLLVNQEECEATEKADISQQKMCPIPQILLEPRHRKYDKVEPFVMIVGSQGTPIGEDKSLGVEEEIANVEIGMNTEQYEPIDRGKECTSESKVPDLVDIAYRTELKNYMHSFSTKIIKTVTAFPNEISNEMDINYAIEEDKGGIGEPWREVDEEGKRINSIDFSLSSAINLITELDVVIGLQLTYDGKLEVKDVLNFMENGGLVAPTVEKVEIDFYTWGEVFLMVSSSGKNLFPGDNMQLKRAHEGHQDKANIMCSQIEAYKNELPIINIVVWQEGKMWRTVGHTQSLKMQGAVAALKNFMAAYLVALDSKGSHVVTSRHCEKLTDFDVAFRQGSTLPLGASYKIIQTVDQSIPWIFLLAMLALANFERLENGGKNIVASLKEKQCSYHVDHKSKLGQLKHNLKFMNKLCNTINVERHRLSCILRLIVVLSVLSIVSFTWFIIYGLGGEMQQQLLMVMKMHSLPDGLAFAIRSEIDATKTTFISRVMKKRYGIKDVFLPCDLLRDILTGREHLQCSGRLTHFKSVILRQILEEFLKDSNLFCGEAVDKAFGKQGRYMRRRLNVTTLLVPKTTDRKFFDIELKDIALCWFSPCCMTLLSMNFGSIIAHGRGYP